MGGAAASGDAVRVTIERRFDAAPEEVFDAWLDPDVARRWLFTSPDSAISRVEIDASVGGSFVFVDQRDGKPIEHQGTYLEIDRPHRLVFRFWTAEKPEAPDLLTALIRPDGEGCVLTLHHDLHPYWAKYVDFTNKEWTQMFALLDGVLAEASMR